MLYTAVYTSKLLRPASDAEIIRLFKKAQRLDKEHNLTGCLVHHKDEFIHFVEGDTESINKIYIQRGIDNCLRHGFPLYEERKVESIFEYPYIVSESLWQLPECAKIPVLNHTFLAMLRETLGNRTLALHFFWECFDEIVNPAKIIA